MARDEQLQALAAALRSIRSRAANLADTDGAVQWARCFLVEVLREVADECGQALRLLDEGRAAGG